MTVWQRAIPFLPAFAISAAFFGTSTTEAGTTPPGGLPGLLAFWIALLILTALFPHRFGITLTPSAAVVHNLRRRTIPWSDIQAVQPESLFGTTTIVLYEANGRRTRLRAPSTGFLARDRHFEEKFHTIGTWWLTHRGPDWTPVPPRPVWPTTPTPPAPDENPFAPPA
ncbi:hypothetical protein AB0I51_17095 [Streptomyces sp. NPDC050549]|uniref:hypothetical protein n=1 Tax=Streptomyces sp. NPDC050549 TaxID=3155406 RepID=UPI003417B026